MGKATHHRWEECSYDSLPHWVKDRLQKVPRARYVEPRGEEGFFRGRSFFYTYQRLKKPRKPFLLSLRRNVHRHYKNEDGLSLKRAIYHRKLRYHSKRRCKYFENWNPGTGADCNYDRGDRHGFDWEKLTEGTLRQQDWLDGLAFSLAAEEGERRFCGDWCPGYEP